MKPPRALPLLPGWDASPSQATQHEATREGTGASCHGGRCVSLTVQETMADS